MSLHAAQLRDQPQGSYGFSGGCRLRQNRPTRSLRRIITLMGHATTWSPSPRAKAISVALGRREAILIVECCLPSRIFSTGVDKTFRPFSHRKRNSYACKMQVSRNRSSHRVHHQLQFLSSTRMQTPRPAAALSRQKSETHVLARYCLF